MFREGWLQEQLPDIGLEGLLLDSEYKSSLMVPRVQKLLVQSTYCTVRYVVEHHSTSVCGSFRCGMWTTLKTHDTSML